tara:strand:+ start:973 stop:1206 length:234 start_codon:yes stop_codon:yes gene_type:complete
MVKLVGDQSGYSVSLSSDATIVAIGAVYNSTTGLDSGQVRVYQYSPRSQSQPRSFETIKNNSKHQDVLVVLVVTVAS